MLATTRARLIRDIKSFNSEGDLNLERISAFTLFLALQTGHPITRLFIDAATVKKKTPSALEEERRVEGV